MYVPEKIRAMLCRGWGGSRKRAGQGRESERKWESKANKRREEGDKETRKRR